MRTREDYNETLQKLSKHQEDGLSKWIVIQGKLGYAPPHARLRAYAQRLLINSGSTERLGKKWVARFLDRHPEIRTLKGRAIDYRRLNGATTATGNVLFDRLALPEVRAILARNKWNANEFGVIKRISNNFLMLNKAFKKFILLKDVYKRK